MFSRIVTTRSTSDYSMEIERLKSALSAAEAVIIGAGAGLSTAAGFTYSGDRFRENFADLEEKYGFHDMYSGGFFPYKTPEEFWSFWSRNIMLNRYTNPAQTGLRRSGFARGKQGLFRDNDKCRSLFSKGGI